ncbi:carbohydrate ABC transporter permease [Jiangella gansuensis]|uniref:carbohydrate ABC transporter permease n=1 Tax=Jiangella gansuensis TaxID=281473 RepID=UPI0004B0BC4F|nr:sugar ABC transporter permease [Jiangella gansuensis]
MTITDIPRNSPDDLDRRRRTRTTPRRRRLRRRATPYLLIAPTLVLFAVFLAYPIGNVFYFSLRDYNITQPWNDGFVGLDNFRAMLDDDLFWQSLIFSVKWVVVEVGLQLLLGLGGALVLNQTFVGRGLARALIFAPWAVSGVLTTAIFSLVYNPATGVMRVLSAAGIGDSSTAVLSNTDTVFWAAVVAELWHGVPFFAILLLAALQTVPPELYEASAVDGAGRWHQFRAVTLPHLKETIVLASLLRIVWEFNNVDLLYSLTGGGPANQTTTLPLYIARTAIHDYDFGYGAALTVAAFLGLLLMSLLYLRLVRLGDEE